MEILNVKVERRTKEKLNRLVQGGFYKNTSEAVRRMLEEHFQKHPEIFDSEELDELFREAEEITDDQFEKLAADVFRGRRTAAELVAEGRGRF